MTPTALVALVQRALGRPGTRLELEDWSRVLVRVPDDVADQALLDHRASSPHPPTLADVRRCAVTILNDRAMRREAEQRQHELQTGQTLDGRPLVPMPAQVREAAAQLAARQRARSAALQPDADLRGGPAEATDSAPARTWPCCSHCTGNDDVIGHPPHRTPCDLCPATEGASA